MAETDKFLVTNIRQYLDSDNPRLGEEKLIQELSECYISLFSLSSMALVGS